MTMRIPLKIIINTNFSKQMRLISVKKMTQTIFNLSKNTNNQGKLQTFNSILYDLKVFLTIHQAKLFVQLDLFSFYVLTAKVNLIMKR